jgi:2-iminobutanoate/2-iminopropanoate deaminase
MKKEIINPEGVEKPRHPHVFSQGIKISGGSILFLAGQVPVDADGKTVGLGDVRAQARQVLENMKRIVEAAGGSLRDVAKLTVYLPDMSKPIREEIWEVRNQYFTEPAPCSMAIGVKGLASPDWYLEVDAWAVIPN